jgi:hypothetical protein
VVPACCWSKRCLSWALNFGLCARLSGDFFLLSSSCFFFLSPVPDEGRPQELNMVTLEALGASGRAADGGEKGRPRRRGNPRRRSARACEIRIYGVFSPTSTTLPHSHAQTSCSGFLPALISPDAAVDWRRKTPGALAEVFDAAAAVAAAGGLRCSGPK